MSVLNPNSVDFSSNYHTTSGLSLGRVRITTLSRSNSAKLGDITPIAIIEVAYSAAGINVPNELNANDSAYVLEALDTFLAKGSVTISQASLSNLMIPSELDTLWKVAMEITSDRTTTGKVTRIQMRSFKSIVEYLGVNKPSSDISITISK